MAALGATLYHAVEGQPPFDADGLHALAVAVFTRPHRPPVHAGPLAPMVDALLVKPPEQRVGATEAGRMPASVLRSLPAASLQGQMDQVGAALVSRVGRQGHVAGSDVGAEVPVAATARELTGRSVGETVTAELDA